MNSVKVGTPNFIKLNQGNRVCSFIQEGEIQLPTEGGD